MSDRGIFVSILPKLETGAFATAVTEMKGIFDKAGADMSRGFEGPQAALAKFQAQYEAAARAQLDANERVTAAIDRQYVAQLRLNEAKLKYGEYSAAVAAAELANVNAANSVEKAFRDQALAVDAATAAHGRLGQAAQDSQSKIVPVFNTIGAAAAGAVVIVGAATGKIAAQLEQNMNDLAARGQEATSSIGNLTQKVFDLSSQVPFGAKELSKALQEVESAGYRGQDAINVLGNAAKTAAIYHIDLKDAVDGVTTNLRDMGVSGETGTKLLADMNRLAGQLTASLADLRNADPAQMFRALGNVEPTALTAMKNLPSDQASAQILSGVDILSQVGIGPEQGSANLSRIITSALSGIKPGSPQFNALQQLGISPQDVSNTTETKGYLASLQMIQDAIKKQSFMGPEGDELVHMGWQYNPTQLNELIGQNVAKLDDTGKQFLEKHPEIGQGLAIAFKLKKALAASGMSAAEAQDILTLAHWEQIANAPSKYVQSGGMVDVTPGQVAQQLFGTGDIARTGQVLLQNLPQAESVAQGIQQRGTPENFMSSFNQAMQATSMQWKQLGADAGTLAAKIGNELLPTLKEWVQDLTGIVNWFGSHKGVLDGFLETLKIITEVWLGNKIVTALGGVIEKFVPFTSGISAAGTEAEIATTKMGGLAGGLTNLASKIVTAGIVINQVYDWLDKHQGPQNQPDNKPSISGTIADILSGNLDRAFGHDLYPDKFPDPRNLDIPHPNSNATRMSPDGGKTWMNWDPAKGWVPENAPGAPPSGLPSSPPPDQSSSAPGTPGPTGAPGDPVNVKIPGLDELLASVGGIGPGGADTGDTTDVGMGGTGGIYNPFTNKGGRHGGGLLADLAQWATTLLAELALGNPLGKLLTGQVGGEGSDADVSATVDQLQNMTAADRVKMENDLKLQTAINTASKAKLAWGKALLKYGAGSEQEVSAKLTYLNSLDRIEEEGLGMQDKANALQQQINDPNTDPAKIPGLKEKLRGYTQGVNVSPSSYSLPSYYAPNASKDQVARDIINAARSRGLSNEATLAMLAVGLQETRLGSDPATNAVQNQNGTPGIQGVFQQDNSYNKYGDKTDPMVAATGFADQFVQRGGLNAANPWGFAVHNVQRPAALGDHGYDDGTGNYLQSTWRATAQDYLNRLGGAPAGPPGLPPTAPGGIIPPLVWTAGKGGPFGGRFVAGIGDDVPPPPPPGPNAPPRGTHWVNDGTGGMFVPDGPTDNLPWMGGPDTGGRSLNPSGAAFGSGGKAGPPVPFGQGAAFGKPASGVPHQTPGYTDPGTGNFGPGPGNSVAPGYGSQQNGNSGNGPGFSISGGPLGAAEGAAAMAANAFAPGSGAAVQVATAEANRLAGYIGQLGGVAAEGLLETFSLSGANFDPAKSLPGRIIGGIVGGKGPSTPNTAGMTAPALKPQDQKGDQQQQGQQFPGINIENQIFNGQQDAGQVNAEMNRNMLQNAPPWY